MLVGVWEDVEYEGGRVLQVHFRMLAHLDNLVHQLPGFFDGLLVDDEEFRRRGDGAGNGPLHAAKEALRLDDIPWQQSTASSSSGRHFSLIQIEPSTASLRCQASR